MANSAKIYVDKGVLKIELPLQEPTASASGKTFVVATTHGNKATDVQIKGPDGTMKALIVGVNAYISAR